MVKKSKKKPSSAAPVETGDSRLALLNAAKKLFGNDGYESTSTRDIAKAAGVNISLISYHFNGKEGLLRACLEEMSDAGLETVERVLKKPTSLEDFKTRFQIFLEEFLEVHINNSDTSCVLLREITNAVPNPIVVEVFKSRFVVVFDRLVDFLNTAQKLKFIPATYDTEISAAIMMGSISHMLKTEAMRKAILKMPGLFDPDQRAKTVSQMATQILNGTLAR